MYYHFQMGSNLGAVLVAGLGGLALQLLDAVRDGEAPAEDERVPFVVIH